MDHHSRLEQILLESKSGEYSLYFNESSNIAKPKIIDICEKLESGKDYFFSHKYNGIEGKTTLMEELKRSSICSGFPIDIRNSKPKSSCKKGVDHEIYVSCLGGIKYTETKKKERKE